MSTGQKIKELRLKRNLTQEYMAAQIGITAQGYGKIENEKAEVTLSNLKKIAKELGVSVGHLAEDEALVYNNYGDIKDGGNGTVTSQTITTYHQENAQIVEMLQNELKFWKEKYEQDMNYYKTLIEKFLEQK